MTPSFPTLVPLADIALYALFNPALIGVAFYMGRKADQPAKLLVASFAGAAAGFALLYVLALTGLFDAPVAARAAAGIFVVSLLTGLVYAWIGYRFKGSTPG
jgi:hypothetical protein